MPHRKPSQGLPITSPLAQLSVENGLQLATEDWFSGTDDKHIRYASWQSDLDTENGTIIFLNGRAEFIEKYLSTYKVFSSNGMSVWTMDWRGQGLSERDLVDRHKGHIQSYDSYINDLKHFLNNIVKINDLKGKTIIIAHSMGGHILLRYLSQYRISYPYIVLSCPLINLHQNNIFVQKMLHVLQNLGLHSNHIPGMSSANKECVDDQEKCTNYKKYTHCLESWNVLQEIIKSYPSLLVEKPTIGWLHATLKSIEHLENASFDDFLSHRIRIISANNDQIVDNKSQERFAKKNRLVERDEIPNAGHEIFIEKRKTQEIVYRIISEYTKFPINF